VTYKKYDAVMNSASNENVKIYDIKLYFEVDIVGKEGGDVSGKYEIEVSYQRVYEVPDTPVSETVIENVEYVGQFDTITKKLFTVRQEVNGDFVTYTQNNEEISKEHFERKLNLEAIFDIPAVVYVNSEQELADVSLTSSSKDGNKETKSSSDGFTTITRSQNYNFKFNCNENVVSATEYDRETYGDTLLIYSSIDNITYKNCNVEKNEAKSNVDSTVYDVMLYFNVNVKRHVKTTSKTHLVAVPYARVLKHVAKDTLVKKIIVM
jgi:SHS2 domain-containing protein